MKGASQGDGLPGVHDGAGFSGCKLNRNLGLKKVRLRLHRPGRVSGCGAGGGDTGMDCNRRLLCQVRQVGALRLPS